MLSTFHFIWELLEPKKEYEPVKSKCQKLWDSFDIEKQRYIYRTIREKKEKNTFLDYNPLFAIQKNANPPPKRTQTLSYDAYYDRYHTTLETDGWKREFLEDERRTIYVKRA